MHDELSIETSIFMKGDCIYIPPDLLNRTLANLQIAHQGIEKMKSHAREAVYWPGIQTDIAYYVLRCTICIKHKASLPAQPMLPK